MKNKHVQNSRSKIWLLLILVLMVILCGLLVWASYPAGSADLSQTDIPVILIYGTLDPRVDDAAVLDRQHLLPEDTLYVRIDGGDHHQFGSYEIDPENDHATIERKVQHEQIVQPTLDLLKFAASSIGDIN